MRLTGAVASARTVNAEAARNLISSSYSSFVKTTFVGAADARGRTKDGLAVGGRGVLEAIASRVLVTIEAELGGEMSVLSGKGVRGERLQKGPSSQSLLLAVDLECCEDL